MSRKNNKSIKKRYNNFLKSVEKAEEVRIEIKIKNKEEKKEMEQAEEELEVLGLDEQKPERMEVEKVKKNKKIKKLARINKKGGEKKRRIK